MVKKFIFGLLSGLIVMMLLMTGGWIGLNRYADKPVLSITEQDFTIEKGDSLRRVAKNLHTRGIIEHPEVFSIIGQISGTANTLHAGDYQILPNTSVREVLAMFTQGQVRYYDITLIEGLTFNDMLEQINNHPKISQPLNEQSLPDLFKQLNITTSPEGLFYPDTYYFEAGTPAKSILSRAHNRLQKVLDAEWKKKSPNLPYGTPYKALIMASIIEKETGVPSERPDIAGVFTRRLLKGMRLQSDPTVIYGMGKNYQGKLNRKMLRTKTAYNTYVIKGMPPTPIALVGRDALRAALNPSEGKSLYFVAKGDGTHYFSASLTEHNKAVKKYQINERKVNYRSTAEVH